MPKETKKTAPSVLTASIITSLAALSVLKVTELCTRFAERATVTRSAFAEMGKLHRCITGNLKKGQTIYGELRKLGVKDSTISNASYAARTIENLVEKNHITEAEYDAMTFADHLAISRVMGDKSKLKLDAVAVAELIHTAPDSFDAEMESIFDTGLTIAEAEAQAAQAVKEAEAKKQKEIADAAAALAAKQSAPPAPAPAASAPAPQAQAPAPTATAAAPQAGAAVDTSVASTATPPADAPAAQAPADAPANVTSMPSAPATVSLQECMDTLDILEASIAELSDADAETVFNRIGEIHFNLINRLSKGTVAKAA